MLGMFNSLHASDSPLNLLDLDHLAKITSFIRRKTQGFSALSIIIALLKCLQKGDASCHHLSIEMEKLNPASLCRRAIHDRINAKLVGFLKKVLTQLIPLQLTPNKTITNNAGFGRIIIEDSTFVPMGAINAGNFPAFGNNRGVTAGFKLDLAYDILSQTVLHQRFGAATQSDKKYGDSLLEQLQPRDLMLRDMGYFSRKQFDDIESKSAFWLSRPPASIDIRLHDGTLLEKKLRSRKHNFIDETVTLGTESGRTVRLVAVRADQATASQRRRERKKVAEKFGNQPRHQSLVRDGWHLMLTNLDETYEAKTLFELYALRWNIETRFKAWKQSIRLKEALKRYSNIYHLESVALVGFIHMLLTNHIYQRVRRATKRVISIEKLSDVITSYVFSLKLNDLWDKITLRIRHVTMEIRGRKSLMQKLLTL